MKIKKIFSAVTGILLLTFIACRVDSAVAQDIPKPMQPARLVNDFAKLFSDSQQRQLEDSLLAFERATSTQIVVVTVNDLNGYAPSDFATRILEQWGVGQKDKDNGVVLLLKPRNEHGRGEVFIATGYGVEGALPDITAGRIIDFRMMKHLQAGDYFRATEAGVKGIMEAVRGEFTNGQTDEGSNGPPLLVILGFITLAIYILTRFIRGGRGGNSGGRGGTIFFPPFLGGSRGGFGGGRSGGFGGFGGGSGGGGGAGRSF